MAPSPLSLLACPKPRAALRRLSRCWPRAPLSSAPIHGDNDPHPGVDRARALPIQGIDIARYQGRVDFRAARADGMHFVFMKGTEGKDYIDPNFYDNWRQPATPASRAAPITS